MKMKYNHEDKKFMSSLENRFACMFHYLITRKELSIYKNLKHFKKYDFDKFDSILYQTASIITYATEFALMLKRII